MRDLRLLALLLLVFPSLLSGEDRIKIPRIPVEVSASRLEYDRKGGVYLAEGEAQLLQGESTLKADFIRYDEEKAELFAEGHVAFIDKEIEIHCERLRLNTDWKVGEIEKGRIYLKEGEYYIEGERIEKKGERRYGVVEGGVTTCGFVEPAWKIVAKDADIEVGRYAKIRHSRFQVKGLPIFYLPYGIFPVMTERQSGFLIPDLASSSRHGLIVRNSYFWAISEDKDITLTMDYMGKRGLGLGSEFRYALREDLKGRIEASSLEDRRYGSTRYRLEAEHSQRLKGDVRMELYGIKVSDIDYLVDFGTSKERREGLLKSFLFFEKFMPQSLLTSEFSYFRTLVTKDNSSTFQYLPFLSFSTEALPIKERVFFHFYSDLMNFYREKGNLYTRLSLEPKFSLPLYLEGLSIQPSATIYETFYLVEDRERKGEKDSSRETFKFDVEGTTSLLKEQSWRGGMLEELLRPFFRYTFIPAVSTDGTPYIDPYDRIYRTHILSYGFDHYLGSPSASRTLSELEISQSFGIDSPLKPSSLYSGYGERLSDVSVRWNLYPLPLLSFQNESSIDLYGRGLRTFKNSLVYEVSERYHMDISHNYVKDSIDELSFYVWARRGSIEGRCRARYSFKEHLWIDSVYGVQYSHKCYAIDLALVRSERPKEMSIRVSVELTGITGRR